MKFDRTILVPAAVIVILLYAAFVFETVRYNQKARSLETENSFLRAQVSRLEDENASLGRGLDSALEEVSNLTGSQDQISIELNGFATTLGQMELDMEELEKQNVEYKAKNAELSSYIETLEEENSYLRDQCNYVFNRTWLYNYTEDDIELLANLIYYENYSTGRWEMMLTGSVVLNRVLSPKFPDTIREVIYEVDHGYVQYSTTDKFFTKEIPEECYKLAKLLLQNGPVCPESVVYQATFEQGDGIYWTWKGEKFCFKNFRESLN